jgi:hypothetical protein
MLEKPHHPQMVEGGVREGQLDRIGTTKVGTQAKASEVSPSCLQLAFLDVHSCQHDAGKRLTEDPQHRPHPTTDFQQTRPGSQPRPRKDQLFPPVFGLQQQALLLVARVAVNVPVSHARECRPRGLDAERADCRMASAAPAAVLRNDGRAGLTLVPWSSATSRECADSFAPGGREPTRRSGFETF